MSIKVSGYFCINSSNLKVQDDISFLIMESACEFRIGCKMGGNISRRAVDNYKSVIDERALMFELMDTPLDNTADELFGNETYGNNVYEEKLLQRLSRIQHFFQKCLKNPEIDKIVLDINYLDGFRENYVELRADRFAETVYGLYEKNSIYSPVLSCQIKR